MLIQSRLKVKAVFLVAALSLTACGQNANIAKKGPSSTSQIDKAKAPQTDPLAPNGSPTSTPNSGPTKTPGTNPGVTPLPGSTPRPAPGPNTPSTPKPGTPSGPGGPGGLGGQGGPGGPGGSGGPGAPGSPGAPGGPNSPGGLGGPAGPSNPANPANPSTPTIPTTPSNPAVPASRENCGFTENAPAIFAMPLIENKDYKAAELPYKSTKAHKIGVLQFGQSSPGKILNGYPYVQNTQVLFKLPLHLPAKEAITKIYEASIQLSITKLSNDGHPKTEWICFLDQKICSGRVFDEKDWQGNINDAFWGKLNNELKNSDTFSRSFIESPGNKIGTIQGMDLWLNESFTIKIEDLIKGSNYEKFHDYRDVLAFLYDGATANASLGKDLRVVVADDTRVSNAKLVFEYQEDTCKAFDLQALQPAQPAPAAPATATDKGVTDKSVTDKKAAEKAAVSAPTDKAGLPAAKLAVKSK